MPKRKKKNPERFPPIEIVSGSPLTLPVPMLSPPPSIGNKQTCNANVQVPIEIDLSLNYNIKWPESDFANAACSSKYMVSSLRNEKKGHKKQTKTKYKPLDVQGKSAVNNNTSVEPQSKKETKSVSECGEDKSCSSYSDECRASMLNLEVREDVESRQEAETISIIMHIFKDLLSDRACRTPLQECECNDILVPETPNKCRKLQQIVRTPKLT